MHTYMKSCCCTVVVLYKMGREPKRIGAVKIITICRIGAYWCCINKHYRYYFSFLFQLMETTTKATDHTHTNYNTVISCTSKTTNVLRWQRKGRSWPATTAAVPSGVLSPYGMPHPSATHTPSPAQFNHLTNIKHSRWHSTESSTLSSKPQFFPHKLLTWSQCGTVLTGETAGSVLME